MRGTTLSFAILAAIIDATLGSPASAVDTTWTLNGNGNWNVPGNWSAGEPINSTFDVFIDDGDTAVTVTLNVNRSVNILTIGADDTLSFADTFDLTIAGPSLVNNGLISLNAAGVPNFNTDINFTAPVATLSGTGTLLLGGAFQNRVTNSSVTNELINSSTHTIAGGGQFGGNGMKLTNEGLIDANIAAMTMFVDPSSSNAVNTGTMRATNGGILRLQGGVYTNTSAFIRALEGSFVELTGGSGAAGTTIVGGTLVTEGSGAIRLANSSLGGVVLQDVTLAGGSLLQMADNDDIALKGTFTNDGTVEQNSAGALNEGRIDGSVTITGSGVWKMSNAATNRFRRSGSDSTILLTNDTSHTIQGAGAIGSDEIGVVNAGLIHADQSTAITIDPSPASIGMLNESTGVLRASGSGGLLLTGGNFENQGTIEALNGSNATYSASGVASNNAAGVLTGGTWRAIATGGGATVTLRGSNITQIAAGTTVELSGAGSAIQVVATPIDSTLATNAGTLKILNGRTFTMTSALTNTGTVELGGAGLAATAIDSGGNITNSASGVILGHGTISDTILNSGTVRAANGTLAVVGGIIDGQSGTIEIAPGATLDLSGASGDSDTDNLIHNGAGLNLGANDVLVRVDYANANFGTGNAFNPRANVTGTGEILASPAVSQQLAGDVSGGAIATPTLDMGVVRIGQPGLTKTYDINIVGAGASITGAVMSNNGTFGASITNSQLSGSGVVAGDFSIAAGSNITGYEVTLTGTPGGQGALSGQTVAIVNNFDNVPNQVLTINGEVWQPAVPNITPAGPVNLGNFHVGDIASQQLSIANNAVVSGFSESLIASVLNATGNAQFSGGPSVTVAPGASNNTIGIGVSTTTGGAKAGSVQFSRASSGATGLADLDLGNQTVNVSANVYRFAVPVVNNLNLGDRHVGDMAQGTINVQNTAIVDSFSESLRASTTGFSGGVSAAAGTADVAPGGNSGNNLTATLNTATAGAKSGTVEYSVTSLAQASGLSDTTLPGTWSADVTGSVYNLAVGQVLTTTPINFGFVHVGDNPAAIPLSIKNNAPAGAFSERLDVSTGTHGTGVTGSGTINNLAAQATNNSALTVDISTASASTINANYVVKFTSDGTGVNSLGQTPLADVNVPVTAQVNNYAIADVVKLSGGGTFMMTGPDEFTLDLGSIVEGQAALSATLGMMNDAAAPADSLAGSFTPAAPDFTLSGFAPFAGVAAGATQGGFIVSLDDSAVGDFTGQITLQPQSTNPQPFSQNLDPITIHLVGEVRLGGDYNLDGTVNAADYTVWRNTLGQTVATGTGADGSGPGGVPDGMITTHDYAHWKSRYGNTAPGAGASTEHANVPEPASPVLLLLGVVWLITRAARHPR